MRRSERDLAHAAKKTTRRSLLLGGAMSSVVGVLGFRMWQLGVRDSEQYYLLAEENRISLRLVRPDRGRIFDSAGKIIADNEQAYRITLVREEARDVEDVLEKLRLLLGLDEETLTKVREQTARVDEQSVLRIAGEVGLDVEQLKVDMQSPEVEEHIATSLRLAEALGFNGTPSFVVGDQLIPGFVEKAQLAEVVAAARAAE